MPSTDPDDKLTRGARPSLLRRGWVGPVLGALVGALLLLLLGPQPAPLGPPTGDPALAEEAAAALAPSAGYAAVSVARISDGRTSWAGFGDVTEESRFELGSITKTFNGLLLADAAERGEARLDDRLDTHLPELAGAEVGTVTLEELASHRAGLPDMVGVRWLELIAEGIAGAEYTAFAAPTPESLIQDAAALPLSGRGEMRYSNVGTALLGEALTRSAGASDWPTLVTERVLEPLGMTDTVISWDGPAPADLMQPNRANGRPAEPWLATGYAPAGIGVTTTAADLTRYAQALLDGTAPGMDALPARWSMDYGQEIGLAWITAEVDGHPVSWHNGKTGGSSSMLAVDRERGTAVIVLTNTAKDVTGAGFALVGAGGAIPAPPPIDFETLGWVLTGLLTAIAFGVGAVRGASRLLILGEGLAVTGALLLWWLAAPWDWAPPWLFGLAAGLTLGALVVAVRRWPRLPGLPARRRWLALAVLTAGSLWFVAMLIFAVQVLSLRP